VFVEYDLPFSQVVKDLKQTLWPIVLQLNGERSKATGVQQQAKMR